MREKAKMTHEEMVKRWKQDPEFLKECEVVKAEFQSSMTGLEVREDKRQNVSDVPMRKPKQE